jgi:hypothetical protein
MLMQDKQLSGWWITTTRSFFQNGRFTAPQCASNLGGNFTSAQPLVSFPNRQNQALIMLDSALAYD